MSAVPTTRREAIRTGSSHYFTGRPCKHGHVAVRRRLGSCVECESEFSRRPERILATRQRASDWSKKHTERARRREKEYRVAHPEKANEWRARWRAANPDYKPVRRRRQDPIKKKAYEGARRARKVMATPAWVEPKELMKIYQECPQGHHVDHVVPLQSLLVCGLHVPCNLQYLTASENVRKKNTFVPQEHHR